MSNKDQRQTEEGVFRGLFRYHNNGASYSTLSVFDSTVVYVLLIVWFVASLF